MGNCCPPRGLDTLVVRDWRFFCGGWGCVLGWEVGGGFSVFLSRRG